MNLYEYGLVRVGASSPEMRVADPEYNADKVIEAAEGAASKKCSIVLFPELSLSGYTCGDLFFQAALLESSLRALDRIAEASKDLKICIVAGAPLAAGGKLFNCGVVASEGKIIGATPKTFLCNTKEYYEERWFSSDFDRTSDKIEINGELVPFGADLLFHNIGEPNFSFGVEICEDLWAVKPPSLDLALAGAELILNLSASDEYLSKLDYRKNLVESQSARCLSAYAFASCGPNESSTDAVFSGHCIISENGKILSESERLRFERQLTFADIDFERIKYERYDNNSFGGSYPEKVYREIPVKLSELKSEEILREIPPSPFIPSRKTERDRVCGEILNLQATGLAKRLRYIGIKNAVVGVSGGLDSTLALIATVEAFDKLGYDRYGVKAITMPGLGTSSRTKNNAEKLAEALGADLRIIPISDSVSAHFKDINHNPDEKDIVYENAQARERTQILMDLANKFSGLVIGTGDLSEIALGWSTYGGDHLSMYGVNSGVPKTLIKYIINWAKEKKFQGETASILDDILSTPISPELIPSDSEGEIFQETEKEIGPYELHDFFLYYVIRLKYSPKKVLLFAEKAFQDNYDRDEIVSWLKVFYKRFFASQFKRSCMPDGVKIGAVSLSPRADWRMPSDAESRIWLNELNNLE